MKNYNGGEAERLKALHAYDILDTPSELEFDDLTALAAQICQTPIALISLLDQTRQWFKSKKGLTLSETPKSVAFCLHTIQSDRPLVVEDALLDERFAHNPLVTGEPNIRFYAGVPLIVSTGYRIGTLCVIAPVPMQLTEEQIQTLQALSRQVVNLLELRRTNRLLAERESILRSFFDSAPMMMGVVELLEDDILHLSDNAETARLFGIKPLEMQNQRASEMGISADYIGQWMAHYREAQRMHQPQKFEYPHETDAGHRWLSATVAAVEQKEGHPARFAYVVEDISDQKQAEENLKQSEQKFRAIFDGTFQFIGLLNPAGTLIEANQPALEAIGATLTDVVGQPFWATPWWTHSLALQAQLKQAIDFAAQGELVRFEAEHILANGNSIFVDFSIQPIFNDAGNVILLIPEGRDISDRIKAEVALREMNAELEARVQARTVELLSAQTILQASEEKFRQFAENLNQVFWMTGILEETLLYISPAYEKVWGSTCESLYRDPSAWLTAIHPEDQERVRSLLPTQLQSEYDVEYRILRPDSEIRWIRDRSFPIRNAEGHVYRIAGIAEDISDHKLAELSLCKMGSPKQVRMHCNDAQRAK